MRVAAEPNVQRRASSKTAGRRGQDSYMHLWLTSEAWKAGAVSLLILADRSGSWRCRLKSSR